MSYIINNSRGQIVAVVNDGTVNTTATDLALVGRAVTNYGEYQNENYVYLLENFANGTAPVQPILGQLWYNSSTDLLSAYNTANSWTALASQNYVEAAKVSPAFSGVPTAPTAAAGTSTTQLATTAFVTSSPVFTGIPVAPTAAAGTSTTQLATTAFVTSSPQFTGVPIAPTAADSTSTVQLATTAFVQNQKVSPAFTGTPTAPTAAAGTATTQLATTAFVSVSPQFTGIPVAPTAGAGTSTTQLATTEFVTSSPVFNGTPTAPTAGAGTSTTQLATTEFVTSSPVFTGAPTAPTAGAGTANTQLATTEFVTVSPMFTGTPTAPTPVVGANNTYLATTAFVQGEKASPVFTGVPVAPTAPLGTSNTQLATTAFVSVSPQFTGVPTAPTAPFGTSNTQLATTAFVSVSPQFTGVPTAPTAAVSTANTQIATTGFVAAALTYPGGLLGSMAQQNQESVSITGGNISGLNTPIPIASGGTGGNTAASARTSLGLQSGATTTVGTMAVQNATSVVIGGGYISGLDAPIPIPSGGTNANTAAGARTNLGLGTIATQDAASVNLTGTISITGGQISVLDTPVPVSAGGTGANTAAGARTNLGITAILNGLGTISTQNSNSVAITGGSITNITPLLVNAGGTGANTAAGARTNLSAVGTATTISTIGGLTGGGDLTTSRTLSIASNSNGYGTRYVSTAGPTGGVDGDIWYQI